MPKKRFSAEQIVTLLRQIEVSMVQGKPTPVACRDAGISQQSYYRGDVSSNNDDLVDHAAKRGTNWSISSGGSCPSDRANGRTGSDQWDLVLDNPFLADPAAIHLEL